MIGAKPLRVAACLASMRPSSGMSMSMASAERAPRPGMLSRMSKRAFRRCCLATRAACSRSMASICAWICLSCCWFWRCSSARVRFQPAVEGSSAILHQGAAGGLQFSQGVEGGVFGRWLAVVRLTLESRRPSHGGIDHRRRQSSCLGEGRAAGPHVRRCRRGRSGGALQAVTRR